jgi:tetratricopeptide (TPR) repeat protein
VRVLFLISEVHELDHRPEEAKKFYAEAMKLQPDDELGWATRGHARMDKESEAALVDFDRALGFNPRSQDALVLKSLTLSENLKRNHEGIAVLDKFLEYYPQDIAVRMGRGVLLARVGRCEQARKDAEECLRYKPGCAFNFQAAGLYAQISRHEKDTTASKEALRQLAVALQNGYSDLEVLNTDPDLDPIRGDEEFKRLANLAASLKISAGN